MMVRLKKPSVAVVRSGHSASSYDQFAPQSDNPILSTAGTDRALCRYDLADDLLEGASEIAAFLGKSPRQVYHLTQTRRLPVFRLGSILCARKSRIVAWIEDQEAQTLSL
jgi:hypothetical protein